MHESTLLITTHISYQSPEAEIHPSYNPSGEYDQGTTTGSEVIVVCCPPRHNAEQEPSFCAREHDQGITEATEALEKPSFFAGEHGQGTTAGSEVLVVCHPPRHIAEQEPSFFAGEHGQGTTAGHKVRAVCHPPRHVAEQEPSIYAAERGQVTNAGPEQLVVDPSFRAGDTEDEAVLLPVQDA